jgi:O-antigen ligase
MLYFAGIVFIFGLRLWIWKLFPALESGIKDDFSNMIIASLIFGLAIFFFLHKAIRREGSFKSGLEGPLALFIGAAAVSLFWTADMASSVKAVVMLLAYVFVFYILLDALSREYQRRAFLWVFFIGSVVVAGFGINDIIVLNQVSPEALESARLTNKSLYYILTHKRACSLFGWPNVLAGFLMLSMPLAAALFMSVRSWWLKGIAAFGAAMMVAAFFLTFSFLGWSGFMITAGALLSVLIYRRVVTVPVIALKYLGVGIVLAAVLFTGVVLKKDFGASMSPRKEYVRVVRTVIGEHPFLGSGFGAYRFASMRFVINNDGETAFPHNTYAQIWAETGLPGLAAILWFLAAVFFLTQQILRRIGDGKDKILFIGILVGLAAFLVDNINSFTMLKPNASFFFWVWLALFCSYGLRQGEKFRRVVMISFVVVAMAGLFLSTRSALALSAFRTGREAANAGVFDLAQKFFQRAHALDPVDPRSLTAEGDLYFRAYRSTSQVVWLDQARPLLLQAADLAPNYYYNYLLLSNIYSIRGDRVKAERAMARARGVSPYEVERDLNPPSR